MLVDDFRDEIGQFKRMSEEIDCMKQSALDDKRVFSLKLQDQLNKFSQQESLNRHFQKLFDDQKSNFTEISSKIKEIRDREQVKQDDTPDNLGTLLQNVRQINDQNSFNFKQLNGQIQDVKTAITLIKEESKLFNEDLTNLEKNIEKSFNSHSERLSKLNGLLNSQDQKFLNLNSKLQDYSVKIDQIGKTEEVPEIDEDNFKSKTKQINSEVTANFNREIQRINEELKQMKMSNDQVKRKIESNENSINNLRSKVPDSSSNADPEKLVTIEAICSELAKKVINIDKVLIDTQKLSSLASSGTEAKIAEMTKLCKDTKDFVMSQDSRQDSKQLKEDITTLQALAKKQRESNKALEDDKDLKSAILVEIGNQIEKISSQISTLEEASKQSILSLIQMQEQSSNDRTSISNQNKKLKDCEESNKQLSYAIKQTREQIELNGKLVTKSTIKYSELEEVSKQSLMSLIQLQEQFSEDSKKSSLLLKEQKKSIKELGDGLQNTLSQIDTLKAEIGYLKANQKEKCEDEIYEVSFKQQPPIIESFKPQSREKAEAKRTSKAVQESITSDAMTVENLKSTVELHSEIIREIARNLEEYCGKMKIIEEEKENNKTLMKSLEKNIMIKVETLGTTLEDITNNRNKEIKSVESLKLEILSFEKDKTKTNSEIAELRSAIKSILEENNKLSIAAAIVEKNSSDGSKTEAEGNVRFYQSGYVSSLNSIFVIKSEENKAKISEAFYEELNVKSNETKLLSALSDIKMNIHSKSKDLSQKMIKNQIYLISSPSTMMLLKSELPEYIKKELTDFPAVVEFEIDISQKKNIIINQQKEVVNNEFVCIDDFDI